MSRNVTQAAAAIGTAESLTRLSALIEAQVAEPLDTLDAPPLP